MITKKFVPDSWLGHWQIYIDGVLVATCPDSELTETLKELETE